MKRRTVMILASAMLAGSLLATDAQARGGGGHMGGGGGHMGGGFGEHMDGGGHIGGGFGDHMGAGRHTGAYGYGDGHYGYDGLYDDEGLDCSNPDYARTYPQDCN